MKKAKQGTRQNERAPGTVLDVGLLPSVREVVAESAG